MKRSLGLALCLVVLLPMTVEVSGSAISDRGGVRRVLLSPPFGTPSSGIIVTMTEKEITVVRRIQAQIDAYKPIFDTDRPRLKWRIEKAVAGSATFRLSRRVLWSLENVFEAAGWSTTRSVTVIVARSHAFIERELAAINCVPLTLEQGQPLLMGASVCNHKAIVINFTGYFFLTSALDQLSAELESRQEPPLATTDYRVVDRNISGLAHEWTHAIRNWVVNGRIPSDEPAWLREGFAEVMATIARAVAFADISNYRTFHLIRMREFSDWETRCGGSLTNYRVRTNGYNGCEYYFGPVAVELLLADYGGIAKMVKLLEMSGDGITFQNVFRNVYGITLDEFETRATDYIRQIVIADAMKK
jgi:hypothetical protein